MSDCILLDFDGTITYRDTTRYLVFELLKISATMALNSKTRPLAASSLKNHLKGFVTFLIILIKQVFCERT